MADLTTLTVVKLYLGVTGSGSDAALAPLITAASRAVEQYCDREFIQTDRVEYYNGDDCWRLGYLSLDQCPIVKVTRVAECPAGVFGIGNLSTTISDPQWRIDSTSLYLTWYDASGVAQSSTLTLASYGTVALLVDAINLVGSGWAATVEAGYSSWPVSLVKRPQGALASQYASWVVSHVASLCFDRIKSGDCVATIYGRFPVGYQNIEVRYTSGYATIPDAVIQATCAVVGAMFALSTADPTLKSEKIGDYQYVNADGGEVTGLTIPDIAKTLLMNYKRARIL